jgi:hypothetical protein
VESKTLILRVVPNPASDHVSLIVSSGEQSDYCQVVLTDILGRLCKNIVLDDIPPGEHSFDIDIGDLPDGIYALVLQTSQIVDTRIVEVRK